MNLYIVSNEKCAVSVGGEQIGTADCNLKIFFHPGRNLLIEFTPLSGEFCKVSHFFDCVKKNNFSDLSVMPLGNDFLFMPLFKKKCGKNVKVEAYEYFENEGFSATILTDGYPKLIFNFSKDVYMFAINDLYSFAEISFNVVNNTFLISAKKNGQKFLTVFRLNGESRPQKVYDGEIFSLNIQNQNEICITKSPATIAGLTVMQSFDSDSFNLLNQTVSRKIDFYELNKNLLCYSFLEEVLFGGDYKQYLSHTLKDSSGIIPDFFGEFMLYIPLFYKDSYYAVLVYENYAKTMLFNTDNGLISDFSFL